MNDTALRNLSKVKLQTTIAVQIGMTTAGKDTSSIEVVWYLLTHFLFDNC